MMPPLLFVIFGLITGYSTVNGKDNSIFLQDTSSGNWRATIVFDNKLVLSDHCKEVIQKLLSDMLTSLQCHDTQEMPAEPENPPEMESEDPDVFIEDDDTENEGKNEGQVDVSQEGTSLQEPPSTTEDIQTEDWTSSELSDEEPDTHEDIQMGDRIFKDPTGKFEVAVAFIIDGETGAFVESPKDIEMKDFETNHILREQNKLSPMINFYHEGFFNITIHADGYETYSDIHNVGMEPFEIVLTPKPKDCPLHQ